MKLIYHITTPDAWAAAQTVDAVTAASLATEGFIHCSRQAQLLAVANRFFPGATGLLVLAIDEAGVATTLVNEGPAGVGDPFADNVFPHVYGTIPTSAVVATAHFAAAADGRFGWPAQLPRT